MGIRLKGGLLSLLIAFAAVALATALIYPVMASAQDTGTPAAPTIKSDLADYPPGATVTLTGSGWQPGETVDIYVNDDLGKTWEGNFQATADANGNITSQFDLPDWFVATYNVRATGAQSGVVTSSFTDAAVDIQGQNKGSIEWVAPSVQGWKELEGVPLRLTLAPPKTAASTTYTVKVSFDHFKSSDKSPGIQDLYGWTASPGVTFSAPQLTTSTGDVWVYTLTATVAQTSTPFVEFRGKLAAGAHNFTGNSLAVGVDNGGGNISIAKPAAAPGTPDLAVTKTGPTSAAPGETLNYTLSYQNKASVASDATGVQLTDKLPSGVQYVAGSCSGVCTVSGSDVIWDLGTVARGTSGSRTLQVRVPTTATSGTEYINEALIRGDQDEPSLADNTASLKTTVRVPDQRDLRRFRQPVGDADLGWYRRERQDCSLYPQRDGRLWRFEHADLPDDERKRRRDPLQRRPLGHQRRHVYRRCGSEFRRGPSRWPRLQRLQRLRQPDGQQGGPDYHLRGWHADDEERQ
jgi:uncharacterized repeat protein (TIGR01451 family)